MTGEEAVRALSDLAASVGIEVRVEAFAHRQSSSRAKGGLCRIRGQPVVLVDAALSPLEKAGVIGEALGHVDLEARLVPPELRPFLERGHAQVKPLVRPRPLARGRRAPKGK